MSSARTYDAALPLPSVFVAKMKSVKDCLNMAKRSIANPRSKRGKIRVKRKCVTSGVTIYQRVPAPSRQLQMCAGGTSFDSPLSAR